MVSQPFVPHNIQVQVEAVGPTCSLEALKAVIDTKQAVVDTKQADIKLALTHTRIEALRRIEALQRIGIEAAHTLLVAVELGNTLVVRLGVYTKVAVCN